MNVRLLVDFSDNIVFLKSNFLLFFSLVVVSALIQVSLQGNYHVGSEFCGKDSVQLKGSEITAELKYLLNLLTLCWHFSKKPFPLFLEETGYTEENVLLREAKAGVSLV